LRGDRDPVDPDVLAAIDLCPQAALPAGKHIGIFCTCGVARYATHDFDFLVPNHANLLKAIMAAQV
jgi:hypothetical protein